VTMLPVLQRRLDASEVNAAIARSVKSLH